MLLDLLRLERLPTPGLPEAAGNFGQVWRDRLPHPVAERTHNDSRFVGASSFLTGSFRARRRTLAAGSGRTLVTGDSTCTIGYSRRIRGAVALTGWSDWTTERTATVAAILTLTGTCDGGKNAALQAMWRQRDEDELLLMGVL